MSSREEDHRDLEAILAHSDWELHRACGCSEALTAIRERCPAIVICERELPDGNWKDILDEARLLPEAPLVIVASRLADAFLWAEVLNLGGHDVLSKPFDQQDVTNSVGLARDRWSRRTKRP